MGGSSGSAPLEAFLLGGRGGGGEEVFLRGLVERPPPGVHYRVVMEPHESVAGARALRVRAGIFNRVLHPLLWPLPGLRAYDIHGSVDLVHVHIHSTWLRLPPGVPVVFSVGGGSYVHYLEAYLGWSRERVRRRYARARRLYRPLGIRNEVATPELLDAIVVRSPFAARRMAELGVPEEKLHAIPPGFDVEAAPHTSGGGSPFRFLLVGRDPRRKGADLAVEAARALRARGRDVHLRLVGDPAYPEMGGEGWLEGLARVPRDRILAEHLPWADAVLVPSRAEGFGFAAVEAMGAARPVVVADRDALPWIVGSGGLLCAPGDAESLARAMERLVEDPEAARAMGERGRARFEAEFTPERFRTRLGDLYRRLVREAGP